MTTEQRPGRLWVTTVDRVHDVTPKMRRITVTSPELSEFHSNGTDQHIAIYFYPTGTVLPRPFTTEAARSIYHSAKPKLRRYTIRSASPQKCEVDIDFVLHPGDNLAANWAAAAKPGDELIWFGPTPAYSIGPGVDELLLWGDETAIPAIAAIVDEVADAIPMRVHIEVPNRAEEQPLSTDRVTWTHRDHRPVGEALWQSVTGDAPPKAGAKIWGAGERGVISRLRKHALTVWDLPRSDVHLTAYWTKDLEQDAERSAA